MGTVGVLRLDTRFPRPLGDMGAPLTYTRMGVAVRMLTIPQASARRVIQEADPTLLEPFIEGARELERQGVHLITTSCGFLARHQMALQSAVQVPVISSALLWCREWPQPGILTFDAQHLGDAVLGGANVPPNTPILGLPEGELRRVILNDLESLDVDLARSEAVQAAQKLVSLHPQVQHLILECTNLPPYRAAIEQATGLPVHDLETLVQSRLSAWGLA